MTAALVSGASRGIGKSIARKLGAKGYDLALLARSASELTKLEQEIRSSSGSKVTSIACDIADPTQAVASIETARNELGSLSVLICNAGVGKFASALDTTVDDWDKQMSVNARGSFLLARQCAREMMEQKNGQIIFIASDAAVRTFANGSSYCASKYAQYAFANALRAELRPHGVKVSVILPGLVASTFNGSDANDVRKKDWLTPDDVADAVVYALTAPKHVSIDEILLHPMSQDW